MASRVGFCEGITFGPNATSGQRCLEKIDGLLSCGNKKALILTDLSRKSPNTTKKIDEKGTSSCGKWALCATVVVPLFGLLIKAGFRAVYKFQAKADEEFNEAEVRKVLTTARKTLSPEEIASLENRLEQLIIKDAQESLCKDLEVDEKLVHEELNAVLPSMIARGQSVKRGQYRVLPRDISDRLSFEKPNYRHPDGGAHEIFSLKSMPGLIFKWTGNTNTTEARYATTVFAEYVMKSKQLCGDDFYLPRSKLIKVTVGNETHTIIAEERLPLIPTMYQQGMYMALAPQMQATLNKMAHFMHITAFKDITSGNINFHFMKLADGRLRIVVLDPECIQIDWRGIETIFTNVFTYFGRNEPTLNLKTHSYGAHMLMELVPIPQGKAIAEAVSAEAGVEVDKQYLESVERERKEFLEEEARIQRRIEGYYKRNNITQLEDGILDQSVESQEYAELLPIAREKALEELRKTPPELPLHERRRVRIEIPLDDTITLEHVINFFNYIYDKHLIYRQQLHHNLPHKACFEVQF